MYVNNTLQFDNIMGNRGWLLNIPFLSCLDEIDPDEMNVMDQILEVNNSK